MDLKKFASEIRYYSMKSIASVGSGHVGGVLSIADLLAVLYGNAMKIDPQNPDWEERDRLIMSKGHCGPALYAALALKGFFPLEELDTLNQNGTRLPSHCNTLTPGIDMSTGSLGQGASMAVGIALALKMKESSSYTYLLLGDGECDEGQVWEAAQFAVHHKLNRLVGFVDLNKQQLDGYTEQVMDLGDLQEKFTAFGWSCHTVDGHDVDAIQKAIDQAKSTEDKPTMIILDTIKGRGWKKSEGKANVHHMKVTQDDIKAFEKDMLGDDQ